MNIVGKPFKMKVHPYSTHIPITSLALKLSCRLYPDLPIVELGCGFYSTTWISTITELLGIRFISVNYDQEWASKLKKVIKSGVEWQKIDNWDNVHDVTPDSIGLCFVDQEQVTSDRLKSMIKLKDKVKIFVCHDSDRYGKKRGSQDKRIKNNLLSKSGFKYVTHFINLSPSTAIVSDHINVCESLPLPHKMK